MSSSRIAGCTIPLFSLRSERDWGIGEIPDLPLAGAWIAEAGLRLLQLLPAHELAAGETSPYGARTAFGLDPVYIGLREVEELDGETLGRALGPEGDAELARLRSAARVDYPAVRRLKTRALHAAFDRFYAEEWTRGTARAKRLAQFVERERAWCEDLALYVAIRAEQSEYGWETWPEGLRNRRETDLASARTRLERTLLEHHYVQWCAHTQWDRARGELRGMGIELMGDVPFIVGAESADVWAHASQFRREVSLGAPPDAFSEEGQDWGLPAYDWAAMDGDDLAWHRARMRQAGRLYDRFRLDHVVGYFRQWTRPHAAAPGEKRGPGSFDPNGEDAQRQRGERVLAAFLESAAPAKVIAEDLGVIPPFVRETMTRMGLPGYRVIPWEKDDTVYRDPKGYPACSVASWSTHDTAPITSWWGELPESDRASLEAMVLVGKEVGGEERLFAQIKTLANAGSDLVLLQAPELLNDGTRINTPGVVGSANWTYRLPRPLERLLEDGADVSRMQKIRSILADAGRRTR